MIVRLLWLFAVVMSSYFVITCVTPWYYNDYKEVDERAYSHVVKVLTHTDDSSLVILICKAMEDDKITPHEYTRILFEHADKHGPLELSKSVNPLPDGRLQLDLANLLQQKIECS